jgi:hypothetical protein
MTRRYYGPFFPCSHRTNFKLFWKLPLFAVLVSCFGCVASLVQLLTTSATGVPGDKHERPSGPHTFSSTPAGGGAPLTPDRIRRHASKNEYSNRGQFRTYRGHKRRIFADFAEHPIATALPPYAGDPIGVTWMPVSTRWTLPP